VYEMSSLSTRFGDVRVYDKIYGGHVTQATQIKSVTNFYTEFIY